MTIEQKIGKFIKDYRVGSGMSQLELAVEMDAEQGSVCRWENGKEMPRMENLIKIADYFGLKLWAFFKELDV